MICVSLAGRDFPSALDLARKVASQADLFEIRLDALERPVIGPFFEHLSHPLIFTFRAKEEGGFREETLSLRLSLLKEAAQMGAMAVDLELAAGKEAISHLKEGLGKTKLILSFHDFEGSPSFSRLQEIATSMKRLGADWGKIVITARHPEEALEVLRLIPWAKKELGLPLIAFAMGEAGRFSRLVCLLLGAPLTYAAPEEGHQAAPGQITAARLKEMLAFFK